MNTGEESTCDLEIVNLSAQAGISRIAWSGDAVLGWKANLIGLSQTENLYFVALNASVYADRPCYPDQRLSTSEDLQEIRWRLPESGRQAAHGFHNRRYPHGINRLEIGDLGEQEILVCVCDDGDVVVYSIHDIAMSFKAIDLGMSQLTAIDKFIKPVYLYNVGVSSWGISIQKEAMLIAISANNYQISITAVAVKMPSEEDDRHNFRKLPEILSPDKMEPLDRRQDARWVLQAHQANIPNVAFYMKQDSDRLVFLLSSDINSNIIIWNISTGSQPIHKFVPPQHELSHQYGWIALPMQMETFRLTNSKAMLSGFNQRLSGLKDAFDVSTNIHPARQKLPFAILHTRSYQISLIANDSCQTTTSFMHPWREHDRGPPFEGPHMDYGTLKYARHIPQLGAIVAASDAGYVGVFTLTKLNTKVKSSTDEGKMSMRLDAILPFDNQVPLWTHRVRSLWSGLVGIATAPLQGSNKKSFRLILEYGDRTVLCYELFRRGEFDI